MIEKILDWIFKKKVIHDCGGDPYLHRWYVIRTRGFGLFIHKFIRSDEDRALHCHPWDFIVIPIWRGYWEWHSCAMCKNHEDAMGIETNCRHPVKTRVLPILGAKKQPAEYRHRVELLKKTVVRPIAEHPHYDQIAPRKEMAGIVSFLKVVEKPAWSIFIRFTERRDWGFWMPGGWLKWNIFHRENCE